jgi:DNA polymerase III alpha subunit (gram-positive type)
MEIGVGGREHLGGVMLGLFYDLEATDKDVKTARITQIAFSICDLEKKKELFHYSGLVIPKGDFEIHPDAAAITGLDKQQLVEWGCEQEEVLSLFVLYLQDVDYLIAHNLHNYDLPLLKAECERVGVVYNTLPGLIDTRYDLPLPAHIETRKLTYLGAEHGIVNPSAHSARHDTDIMIKLFFMYPLDLILARSKSPNVWVKAGVTFDTKEKAKDKKFMWDVKNKIWVKQFKEIDLAEAAKSFDFQYTMMPEGYTL